jgi:hypothetical protein
MGTISNLSHFSPFLRAFWSPVTFFMFPDVLLNLIVLVFMTSWRSAKDSTFCVWQNSINKKNRNLKATRYMNMQMVQISFTIIMKVFNSRKFLTPNNFEIACKEIFALFPYLLYNNEGMKGGKLIYDIHFTWYI